MNQLEEDVYEMMAIPDRYRVYLTAFRGDDGNMASTIQLAPEAEKRIDSLVARTGRSKDFFLGRLSNAVLKMWRIIILPQTYWRASEKVQRRCTQMLK